MLVPSLGQPSIGFAMVSPRNTPARAPLCSSWLWRTRDFPFTVPHISFRKLLASSLCLYTDLERGGLGCWVVGRPIELRVAETTAGRLPIARGWTCLSLPQAVCTYGWLATAFCFVRCAHGLCPETWWSGSVPRRWSQQHSERRRSRCGQRPADVKYAQPINHVSPNLPDRKRSSKIGRPCNDCISTEKYSVRKVTGAGAGGRGMAGQDYKAS